LGERGTTAMKITFKFCQRHDLHTASRYKAE
jgi:hypothetical protein